MAGSHYQDSVYFINDLFLNRFILLIIEQKSWLVANGENYGLIIGFHLFLICEANKK